MTTPLVLNQNLQINSLGIGTPPSGTSGEIRATNDITAFYSDERLKTEIIEISDAMDKLLHIRGVFYKQNDLARAYGYKNEQRQVGVIAQEIQAILPEAVTLAPFDINEKNESISGENYLTVHYHKIIPLLIEALKEQNKKIERLESLLSKFTERIPLNINIYPTITHRVFSKISFPNNPRMVECLVYGHSFFRIFLQKTFQEVLAGFTHRYGMK